MQLSFENIETIVRCLEMHKSAIRHMLKMPLGDAVAMAAFAGFDTNGAENKDPHEMRETLLMQIRDIDNAREAIRETSGL